MSIIILMKAIGMQIKFDAGKDSKPEERGAKRKKQIEYLLLNILAMDVGIMVGIGGVLFRYGLNLVHNLSFSGTISLHYNSYSFITTSIGWLVILVPAVGGLIAGIFIYYGAEEAKGHGVPEVMTAMIKEGGKIRPRVAIIKFLASIFTFGTGGSAGREGPMVQIGAASGSAFGQYLNLSERRIRILVGAGAAAGIAATFNAPIAGIIFALELILLEFKTRSFVPLVIATVSGTLVAHLLLGDEVALPLKHMYSMVSYYELPLYLGLGLIMGFSAVFFKNFFYKLEDIFDEMKIPEYTKPALGGLALGILGYAVYREFGHFFVVGVGYGPLEALVSSAGNAFVGFSGWTLIFFLLLITVLKMIATSLTLGSGASGGIFAPSLWMGATLGAAYGILMNIMFPGVTAPFAAYAIVGMAAFFAGASRATLTAIVIIFEMTSDYNIILPLMFACVVSDAVSITISKNTIYTEKIARKGIRYSYEREVNILETIFAGEVMFTDVQTIRSDTPLKEVLYRIVETGYQGFPCVDTEGRLTGIVTHADINRAYKEGISPDAPVSSIKKDKNFVVAYPDENMEEIIEKMAATGHGHLPVVGRNNPTKLLGFITREDMIRLFRKKAKERKDWMDSGLSFRRK